MNLKKTIEISVMVGSALLEVGGDALIRKGWRGGGLALVVLGFAVLGSYGVLLTMLELDFSRLLGSYVGLFALVSVLFGWLVFRERIPTSNMDRAVRASGGQPHHAARPQGRERTVINIPLFIYRACTLIIH